MSTDLQKLEQDTQLAHFDQRQILIQGLVSDLQSTLETNVRKVMVEGNPVQAMNRVKTAVIGLVIIMVAFLMRSVISAFSATSEPQAQGAIELLSNITGYLLAIAMFIVIISIVIAGVQMIAGGSRGSKFSWKGKEKRDEKYKAVKAALAGVVDTENEERLTRMLEDSYNIVSSLDDRPGERTQAAKYFSNLFGQVLVSASLRREIDNYGESRWNPENLEDKEIAALSAKQNEIVSKLAEGSKTLQDQVEKTAKQTGELKNDINKVLTKKGSVSLANLLETANGRAKELEEATSAYTKTIRGLHGR